MPDTEYFFHAEQLTVGYNGAVVVKDVEASVRKGQILTLIGPNGSGKSTILKSIAKQIKPISGAVYIGGHSIGNVSHREFSRQTAIVLTARPRPELMTCGDVVAVGRYPYTGMLGILPERDKEKVDEALRLVGASDLKDRGFAEISDGQLQRVMLARAICQEPEIIILDEPTSFLDIRYAVEILDILRSMATERGVTVVMSLHELNYAKRVSDLVMGVKDGQMLFLDTPDRIFTEEMISRLYDLPDGAYRQLFGGL
ncbi:MAG: ABC transporter ATP-binding protein [Oscillospiraceae bacterium]|jgi:iron complex transport system ATP-binding protein|nr:ABC transporter ATP-binding protein [Oscillospiraceae bacterium]